jgi:hypothetical protein
MNTRKDERTGGTSTYRQALRSAMSAFLTAPFFRPWPGSTQAVAEQVGSTGRVRSVGRVGSAGQVGSAGRWHS